MNYKDKYKSLSDYDLIEIIKNKDEFDSNAINEAKIELKFRSVDFEKIILEENNKIIENKINKQQKRINLKNKIKEFINKNNVEVEDYFYNDTLNKSINIFIGILILMFLYDLFKNLSFIITLMFDSEESNLWINLSLLFPYLYRPLMIYFFWKRNKIGWYLINLYYLFRIQVYVVMFITDFEFFLFESYLILYIIFYLLILISLNHKIFLKIFNFKVLELKYFYLFSIIFFIVFWYFEIYKHIIF